MSGELNQKMTTPNLELAKAKLTVKHLAQHGDLADAESLLCSLRETVTFLERRIAREKLALAKSKPVIESALRVV